MAFQISINSYLRFRWSLSVFSINLNSVSVSSDEYLFIELVSKGGTFITNSANRYSFYSIPLKLRQALTAIPNRELVLLAEGTRTNHFAAGFDLTYGWDFYGALINVFNGESANKLYEVHKQVYSNIPEGKHRLRFTTNHDESAWEQTPMVFFDGKEGALTASVLAIYMGGVPLLYTGQEVGRRENVPFFYNSTINWNENPDMLQEYQTLLQFYNQSEAAKEISMTIYPNADVVSFIKSWNNEELLVIANVRDSQVSFALPEDLKNTSWQDALSGNEMILERSVSLGNYEYILLKR